MKTIYQYISTFHRRSLQHISIKKICGFLIFLSFVSCTKFLDIDPPIDKISLASVFQKDITAIAVMTGVYSNSESTSISIFYAPAMIADELSLYNQSNVAYTDLFWNNYTDVTGQISATWNGAYQSINTANTVLEALPTALKLTPAVSSELKGEALFVRALNYFYLVNYFGGVPLVLGTDYKVNASLGRSDAKAIWDQVEADLRASRELLSKNYLDATLLHSTGERVRPNYWAAEALLARTLLYRGKWAGADSAASELINQSSMFHLVNVDSIVQKNNAEAIWQLQITSSNPWTWPGSFYKLPPTGPDRNLPYPVYMGEDLINSFESGDSRRKHWIDSVTVTGTVYRFAYKYKIGTRDVNASPNECNTLLRLGEQYLIRSEARAQMNNLAGAAIDLNAVRQRAGLPNTTAASQQQLLNAIQRERRVELFTEGHRWFDLKRTGSIDSVMTISCQQKGGPGWTSYKALWPIPGSEIDRNPVLKGQQNPGYN